MPKIVPATIVEIPNGNTCAEEGYSPGTGSGNNQIIIPINPMDAIAIARRTAFILCPEPNMNKSLNDDAKQNLDF